MNIPVCISVDDTNTNLCSNKCVFKRLEPSKFGMRDVYQCFLFDNDYLSEDSSGNFERCWDCKVTFGNYKED